MMQKYILTLPALLLAIVLHELGHGYAALAFGDDTAKKAGRLTLNPISHLDLLGLACLYVFRIGWAKPVPINPAQFTNQKVGMIVVSLFGVFVNMVLAIMAAYLMIHLKLPDTLSFFFQMLFIYNISFAVFNLMPIPPLDGSRLIMAILPFKTQIKIQHFEKYSYIFILFLSFSGILKNILIPLIDYLAVWIIHLVTL